MPQSDPGNRLARWQGITLATLLVGYAGYYLCRSNLSVVAPLLLEQYGSRGIDKEAIGLIASTGVLLYAVGKLLNGVACDFLGGRSMFLFGMIGSVLCTVLFGLGTGVAVFTLAWALNRFIQSMGWGAVVKISSRWFPVRRHGTIMAVISLSFLFGDAVARLFLGGLIQIGFGWRGVFLWAAAVLAAIALVSRWTLRGSPQDVGLPEPEANPVSVFGSGANVARPRGLRDLLRPFFTHTAVWLVCALSLGLTLIRETFNLWIPTYLTEATGVGSGRAAVASMIFPLVGGVSALAIGHLSDRVTSANRVRVMIPFLAVLVIALVALSRPATGLLRPLILLGAVSFALIGPYSLLAGVIALDLGGKKGSATAAGLFDSAGYFGGILSGYGIGTLVQHRGWEVAFVALAVVAAGTLLVALVYCVLPRPHPAADE